MKRNIQDPCVVLLALRGEKLKNVGKTRDENKKIQPIEKSEESVRTWVN